MNNNSPALNEITQRFQSDSYQLLEKIGQGGFGQVYKAKQLSTDQFVAIKFLTLDPEFDSDKKKRYIERFERETLLSSRLQHPHIVRLMDKGRCDDDLLYAVFEYVDGQTLKDTLQESGNITPVDAAVIMTQVLDALAHAHQRGVIHRDIKPANIMLTKVGFRTHAKVLDFGIGTLVNEARHLGYKTITLTQETLGTPSYSAPEQLRGEPPTPKTDLYVWGLVFLECLTGQPAVSGQSLASIFHKQLSASNVPLPAAIVGHPVGALLRRVLQKKAHERTVQIDELYAELIKLNFSNLVGEIQAEAAQPNANDTTLQTEIMDDETHLNDAKGFSTTMTERKQLTALFISLRARALSDEVIDHEVIETLHRDQKSQCVDIAVRYGAFHVGTLGKTLMFYFGYPAVSDNDIRLCARAALDIVSMLNKRNSLLMHSQGIVSQARIGIHTGMVTRYSDATPEGNTPDVAMDLANCAAPNQILCSDASRAMLETYIEFEPDKPQVLGVDDTPTPTYSLVGERQVEAFGFLRGTRRRHEFIGRDKELDTLTQMLPRKYGPDAKAKLAHVHGEAGIGKSRLIFELRNEAKQFNHFVAQCLPEHQNNALFPVLNVIRHKLSLDALTPQQSAASIADNMTKLELEDGEDAIAIVCAWLNLPLPEGIEPTALAPDVQKRLLFTALIELMTRHNETDLDRNLYIFEDIHWADLTTLEFIVQFVQSTPLNQSQHVFISTSRQVLPKSMSSLGITCVNVVKLTEDKTAEFIVSLFDKQNVSANVLDVLVTRTDGIPLFIEELVNTLKQKQLVHHINGAFDFINKDKLEDVPDNLRDSLQQKLDTLTYAKETAQLAATIGREFDYDLLVGASGHSEERVQTDLNELVETELVYRQRKVGGDSYLFKHALVRDAAYDSVMPQARRDLHLRVAQCIDKHDESNTESALVASHYAQAEQYFIAAKTITHAIKNAVNLSIYLEAQIYFEQSQQWIAHLPVTNEVLAQDLVLNESVFPAYISRDGFGSQPVADIGERIIELEDKLGVDEDVVSDAKFMSQYAEFQNFHFRSDTDLALKSALHTLEIAKKGEYRQRQLVVLTLLVQTYTSAGQLDKALEAGHTALGLYIEEQDADLRHQFGWEPRCMILCNMSHVYALLGQFTEGYKASREAVRIAEDLSSEVNLELAGLFDNFVANIAGDGPLILQQTADMDDTRSGDEDSWYVKFIQLPRDWANRKNTHITTDFCKMMRDEGRGGPYYFWLIMWLENEILDENYDLPEQMINEILAFTSEKGLVGPEPQLHQMLANIAFRRGDITTSEKLFKQALTQSDKHQSHMISLDITMDYSRLLVNENRAAQAIELVKARQANIAEQDYRLLANNQKLQVTESLLES